MTVPAPYKHLLPFALLCPLLAACNGGDSADDSAPAFTLQLLHASDMTGPSGALENVGPFSAILDALRARYPGNTLVVSSGNNTIPGPRYVAAADASMAQVPGIGVPGVGRADIALLNGMGFQASALGNFDVDGGTATFAGIIQPQSQGGMSYPGARFPYLSANLDFTSDANLAPLVGADGQAAGAIPGRLAGSATVTVGGATIGLVGATTPTFDSITTADDITVLPADDDIDALAALIQTRVDALTTRGIDKVVLLANMGDLAVETQLAQTLTGVDVIVAGGSHTLLADATDRLRAGDSADDTYPLRFTSPAGEPVLLVNTNGDYDYLGRLVVGFDAQGVVLPASLDPAQNGAYVADAQMAADLGGIERAEVTGIVDALNQVLVALEGNVFGSTSVYLDGRGGQTRTQETNLGDLAADANLWLARRHEPGVQAAIQNGGGIRDDIGYISYPSGIAHPDDAEFFPPAANPAVGKAAGEVSQFDIESALAFDNDLVLLTATAQELYDVLENAVSQVENYRGRFPQVSGLRFSFDPSRPARLTDGQGTVTRAGERVRNAALVDAQGNVLDTLVMDGALMGDPNRTIRLVTLAFLAWGGDDYPFQQPLTDPVDLAQVGAGGGFDPGLADFSAPGTEQDALAEYLAATHGQQPFSQAETDADQDTRIQNLSFRGDTVLQ